jgi:hypothetical protein
MSSSPPILKNVAEQAFRKAGEKFELVRALSAKAGEPWISFYADTEIERIFTKNGFSIEGKILLSLILIHATLLQWAERYPKADYSILSVSL